METKYARCPLYNKKRPISNILSNLAAQENCDGVPYDQMQIASEYIDLLEERFAKLEKTAAGKMLISEILRSEKL